MKSLMVLQATCVILTIGLAGCDDTMVETSDTTDNDDTTTSEVLHSAYSEFDTDNVDVAISGSNVIIETNGLPNHTSPYWSSSHELYVDPTVTTTQKMAPGDIDDFVGTYTLTVANSPSKSGSSSATGLGAIGIAVSGSVIYNDEEGPGIPLDNAAGSLDFNGAHTGPQSYHYHLEPISFSDDDSNLIGVISDGFFLYGRKCNSTGTYPTDLDESGGHTAMTQHSTADEYHYHIQNELYLNAYYILFPGNYQGSPNAIQ
ncbi:YHYH protein [Psychrosphaera sp. B3R10]|uniref:YHYH protein n=1 Tax=unclassified Psychrosphaera TaxID=2641570 RepID=UPI001C095834|nr:MULTISPECIES: YHYH protein [unclassified Psychrosphaera]MBU2882748.1 YHYH protein [Psychrosphaera sp. I2R16]MBU2989234.1 YHYH protein [Psychrosphaera sp. B3R10]